MVECCTRPDRDFARFPGGYGGRTRWANAKNSAIRSRILASRWYIGYQVTPRNTFDGHASTTSLKLDVETKERIRRSQRPRRRSPHWVCARPSESISSAKEKARQFRQDALAAWSHYQNNRPARHRRRSGRLVGPSSKQARTRLPQNATIKGGRTSASGCVPTHDFLPETQRRPSAQSKRSGSGKGPPSIRRSAVQSKNCRLSSENGD